MVNLCICQMQVHQSKLSLYPSRFNLSGLIRTCLKITPLLELKNSAVQIPFLASLLFIASFLFAKKGYMHLSAPRNRYMHTIASNGKMLQKKMKKKSQRYLSNKHQHSSLTFVFNPYLFIKLTMYMMRGVQIMGWSVRMALMACFTQNSGLSGGRNGSISFLNHTKPNIKTMIKEVALKGLASQIKYFFYLSGNRSSMHLTEASFYSA